MMFPQIWLKLSKKERHKLLVEAGHSTNLKFFDFADLDWRVQSDIEYAYQVLNEPLIKKPDFGFKAGQCFTV